VVPIDGGEGVAVVGGQRVGRVPGIAADPKAIVRRLVLDSEMLGCVYMCDFCCGVGQEMKYLKGAITLSLKTLKHNVNRHNNTYQ